MHPSVATRLLIEPKLLDYTSVIQNLENELLSSGIDILTVREMSLFIHDILEEYEAALSLTCGEILQSLEIARQGVRADIFYSEKHIPSLHGVMKYDTLNDFIAAIPSGRYICPACKSETDSPYECSAMLKSELHPEGVKCKRRSDGLYRTLHNGVRVIILSEFLSTLNVINIFTPVELLSKIEEIDDEDELDC